MKAIVVRSLKAAKIAFVLGIAFTLIFNTSVLKADHLAEVGVILFGLILGFILLFIVMFIYFCIVTAVKKHNDDSFKR